MKVAHEFFWNFSWRLGPNDCNISTQYIATLLGSACCARLVTLLRRVATCWVFLAQIWKWSNFSRNICECWMLHNVVVVWPGFVQQCCTRACALVRFFNTHMSQQGSQTPATCSAQRCCDMLCWNVPIVWPEFANAGPTMFRCFVLMLRSFDRGFRKQP